MAGRSEPASRARLGVCPSSSRALASRNGPLRAPASPAQFSDCSPRTAGPQPRDVLRLALRRGEASEGGRSPPPSYLGARRVPAPARRAALDPSAVLRAAGGAAVRPLEGAGGLERAAVLQQGLRR